VADAIFGTSTRVTTHPRRRTDRPLIPYCIFNVCHIPKKLGRDRIIYVNNFLASPVDVRTTQIRRLKFIYISNNEVLYIKIYIWYLAENITFFVNEIVGRPNAFVLKTFHPTNTTQRAQLCNSYHNLIQRPT
jgi:hypothetical protein